MKIDDIGIATTYLGNMPLHPVTNHPAFPQRAPIPFADAVLILVVDGRVGRAVVHARLATDNHVALEPAQHCAADYRRPGIHRLHDLDVAISVVGRDGGRVCRPLGVRWRRGTREVPLEPPVQVIALPEAADKYDAGHDAALVAEAVYLALDEVADLLGDGLEDAFDLLGCHDEEAAVDSCLFVVGETREPMRS